MATIVKKEATAEFGGTPYGNTLNRHFVLETSATGGVLGGVPATPIAITDEVVLGVLRSGTRIDDALAIISDAFSASVVGKLGFRYADGVDDTQAVATKEGRALVLQDDDYFFAALSGAATGRTRANNLTVRPVTLPKDAHVVWVNSGAAHASVGRLDLLVYGEDRGPL